MEIKSVTIQHYRSISTTHKIPLERMAVLLGPNNEGKSNVLRALVLAMNLLAFERRHRRDAQRPPARKFYPRRYYDWVRDYPIPRQGKHPKGTSTIILDFQLTDSELQLFREQIKSTLTGSLPIKFSIGQSGYDIAVHKKGPGAGVLSQKAPQIADFIARRIGLHHIPAVRTARQASATAAELVAHALLPLEDDEEYQAALDRVAQLQQPLLDSLSDEVRQTLVQFLPKVKDVRFKIPEEGRSSAIREACEIIVDDGTATLLQHKGDGIQSLVALGVARHAMERSATTSRNLVIAIEEPESHLHPHAIHELREVLREMSQIHQVVLTTHNPLFVDRIRIPSNIIVNDKKATPAKNIEQIRQVLGVRAADNLRVADLVLVVEGETDRRILNALLRSGSSKLRTAMTNHALVVDSLAGAGKLTYKLALLRDSLCVYHCLLDNDKAGKEAIEQARLQGLIDDSQVSYIICLGKSESELEDWVDPDLYKDFIQNRYRVSLDTPRFKTKKKWSIRMKETFAKNTKAWTSRIENAIKEGIADLADASPESVLLSEHADAFEAFTLQLEQRLEDFRADR